MVFMRKIYQKLAAITLASVMLCGCGGGAASALDDTADTAKQATGSEADIVKIFGSSEAEIATLYREIYEQALQAKEPDSLELAAYIVRELGGHGYAAVDRENQIDMVGAEQVAHFCESVDKREEDNITVVIVWISGGFTTYGLHTEDGGVEVAKDSYRMEEGQVKKISEALYTADSWQYTGEGYLIFTGSSYSEESYVLTMSDVPEIAAWRVEPLDAECRELNRRFLLPVGYRRNNMFLCDWSGNDYGELDFYDVFDRFYPMVYGRPVPYVADQNISVGSVYYVPEEEFDSVIMRYFAIDGGTLHGKTRYLSEKKAYEYRPRGFHEVEYANLPYPEVVDYAEDEDSTLRLTVNAVYPSEGTSKAFTHEVVVRPLGQDRFRYVSNTLIPSRDDYGTGWHTNRLTEEAWEELYGENQE